MSPPSLQIPLKSFQSHLLSGLCDAFQKDEQNVCFSHFIILFIFPPSSYDNDGTTKDEIKERFALTMEFVENYLSDVVCQNFPFSDKEKNKLTFEVGSESCFSSIHIGKS